MSETKIKCDHDYKTFKQTVSIDNPLCKWGVAYFIVKGCLKCKSKTYMDYVVQK